MQKGVLARPIDETPIAIVDLETTGLCAGADRIVEIAIIRKEPYCPAQLVLNTLVNPHRRVSATKIHGISDSDVRDAPDFAAIAGQVARSLEECVVAAYHVYFDMKFLADEFERIGFRHDLPHICLMYMRPMLELGPRGPLCEVCAAHGIPLDHTHIASADAEACSALMNLYLHHLQKKQIRTFGQLATLSSYKFLESLRCMPLCSMEIRTAHSTTSLKPRGPRPVVSVTTPESEDSQRLAAAKYWDALTIALADLDISEEENRSLQRMKQELGLQTEQVRVLHARAFAVAIRQFTDDEWLDEGEYEKLRRFYYCLRALGWAPGL